MIRKLRRNLQKRALLGIFLTALSYGYSFALPTDGRIVMGNATISQSGQNMQITQGSDRAILNWQGFNIAQGERVNFQQANSSSVALNRVLGNDPSKIFGQLTANGKVFLLNPNGIVFGSTSRVDVGGLVASTLNMSDSDFMAGRYSLLKGESAGSILNQGNITAADGGYVALLAPNVQNEGTIVVGKLGTVALASGDKITLNMQGDNLISLSVDAAAVDALVVNKGIIKADGGTVIMTAKTAGDLARTVVNNEGVIEAKGLVERDGKILLEAIGGSASNSGTLNASAGDATANGGDVRVLAMDGTATLATSSALLARGGVEGGNGGFIELSGKRVVLGGTVDTLAPNGKTGEFLIDPVDIVINAVGPTSGLENTTSSGTYQSNSTSGSTVLLNSDIVNQLNTTNVTITTQGAASAGLTAPLGGDILVQADILSTTNNNLTLIAREDIVIQKKITLNSGTLTLTAGADSAIATGGISQTDSAAALVTADKVVATANLDISLPRLSVNTANLSMMHPQILSGSFQS